MIGGCHRISCSLSRNQHFPLFPVCFTEKEPGDCAFNPQGFLFLGSEADVAQMQVNHETQIKCGAKVALLQPYQLEARYPWMNLDGIALASYGILVRGGDVVTTCSASCFCRRFGK